MTLVSKDVQCEWFVFPQDSHANMSLQTLSAIDRDTSEVERVCLVSGKKVRLGLWRVIDSLTLQTIKREREKNGLRILIFLSQNGSIPCEWKLADSDVAKRRLRHLKRSVRKRLDRQKRKKRELQSPLF